MRTRNNRLRDEPIDKKVIYIDFRGELSAFDKFFYFGNVRGAASRNKQELIRRKSILLKKILSGDKEYIYTPGGAANKKIRILTESELKWISFILGKEYLEGKFLEHSFFRNDG